MPVTQLQNDTGANLGSALGAAAGYFATQKQRKADKATATARQTELDRQNTQKNQDYHDEVTSKIQETAGQEAHTKENDVNAQFQQAANAKALNLLGSPPAGQDPAQWAQSVWTKATTPPSSGGLGLTDSKMLGELNTQVQAAVAKATQAKQQKFIQGEQVLPSDPKQALGVLGKRQQIEGGQGIDPKRTQDAITAAQKQITEAQAAAYQQQTQSERARHDKAMEGLGGQRIQVSLARGAGGGGGYNSDLQPRAQAIESKALGEKDVKSALRDVETANLPRRDRAEVRQDVMDQFRAPPMAHDTSGLSAGGKQMFDNDVRNYMTKGGDASGLPDPDPSDPKYQKKTAALGGGAPAGGGGAAPGGGGEKRTVSLKAAMALPGNKGKTPQQVQADITAHGYAVAP